MRTLYTQGTNLINLPFCHCSQFLTPNPNVPFLVPSTHSRNILTLKSLSISFNNSLFSPIQASSMASSTVTDTQKPFSVLFVCLGNICRSPAAEGVFTDLVKKRGFDSKFRIDSAGTINYHEVGISKNVIFQKKIVFFRSFLWWVFWDCLKSFLLLLLKGNEADPRMRAASKRRGIEITSRSRPIKSSDFVEFDIILAMDKQNKGRVSDILIWIWWDVYLFIYESIR